MERSRNAYRILVGKPEGKRPLGRLRRRWKDNIKMNLKEMDCDARYWMNLIKIGTKCLASVRVVMNIGVP